MRELLEARGLPARCFVPDADAALEHCEDALLRREAALDPSTPANLEDHNLLRGFRAAEVIALLDVAQREVFAVGDVVFREGDPTDRTFFLLEGTVSVWIGRSTGAGPKRLAVLGPGAAFGEVALLYRNLASGTRTRRSAPSSSDRHRPPVLQPD